MSNQKIEIQKTETRKSFVKYSVGKVITTGVIAVITIFVALIIGLPIYLYLPLGALVFFLVALGFYLFSFRSTNKRLKAEIEDLTATSKDPPPPPKF